MYLKHGVNPVTVLKPEILYGLAIADYLHRNILGGTLVVTSTTDGNMHCKQSAHYTGNAVDLRTSDSDPDHLTSWTRRLDAELTPLGFHVLIEADHLHLSWNPTKGEKLYESLSERP